MQDICSKSTLKSLEQYSSCFNIALKVICKTYLFLMFNTEKFREGLGWKLNIVSHNIE